MEDGSKRKFSKHLEVPPVRESYTGSGKLAGKVAIVTGGDSGIGRAVAVHYAREGTDVVVNYLHSDDDARETKKMVEAEGQLCMLAKGDISAEAFCKKLVNDAYNKFGKLDILVNNAGTHEEDETLATISKRQLHETFAVNIFSMFYLNRAVGPS